MSNVAVMRNRRTVALPRLALALGFALAGISAAPGAIAGVDKTENVKFLEHFPYPNAGDMYAGGTEIAYSGRHLYAAQMGPKGGVHVFDIAGRRSRRLSFIPCAGAHTDIETVEPGLIAVSVESAGICSSVHGSGVALFDVSNPRDPRALGGVAVVPHSITAYPGKPFIYASGGGFGRDSGAEYIIDVSDPKNTEVAATFQPNPLGCHDLAFHVTESEQLAVCVGGGEGQVWDVSDPLAPRTIGHIPVVGTLPHSIAISSDGSYLAIGEESFYECRSSLGALHIYDFTVRQAPVLVGHYETPYDYQPSDLDGYCSPNFAFVPETHTLVASWGVAGMSVLDLTDPRSPTEVAHYVGTREDMTYFWGIEYHRGRIWANDRIRGLDVLKVPGL